MDINAIKEVLGLPPEATDEQVMTAIKAGAQAIEELATERANAEKEAEEAEAEEFAEANKAKADKAVLKEQYLANKEVAKALVAAIPEPKAPEQPQTILNKASAKTPEKADVVKELNKLPAGKARADYVMAHAAELAAAAAN